MSLMFAARKPSAGGVVSVVAGANVTVDDTDPANPIVSASGGGVGPWIPMDLINGWVPFGAPFAVPSYRLTADGQHVELAGVAKSGTPSFPLCTLPAGYHPITDKVFCGSDASSATPSQLSVTTGGNIDANTAIVYPSLDGITFPLDI